MLKNILFLILQSTIIIQGHGNQHTTTRLYLKKYFKNNTFISIGLIKYNTSTGF